ncbi:MAG TPA: hypothetical protein VHO25_11310, partial [Polyangiaceae bacterium]|nr:hypothetical protein [Polyangiaceae bacterium]
DDADFVNAYCKHRDAVVRDPRNFAAMWDSICKFMIHWTMFEERSVDFGFARLDAFCVRANWKNAILGRVMAMRRQTNGPRTAESIRRTTRKLLHQSFISGIDISTMKCRWTLELTPKRTFYEAADLREAKRKLITRGSYLYNVLRQLHSPEHKNRLYECLLEYTRQTKLPYAALPHGFEPRCDSSGKESPINFATPKKWASTPVVAGSKMEDKTGRAVVPEDALLPTMQDLQSLPEDVRHARECVDATGGDEITTLGLLLLHSVEGPAPSELLDDGATGWDGKLGVAPETKQLPNSEESGNAT